MSWERDPLTGEMRHEEPVKRNLVSQCSVLTVAEALADAEPTLKAGRLERERREALRRFGVRLEQ